MAAPVFGLPDAEIDKLLAEAEARLAAKNDTKSKKAVTVVAPVAKAAIAVTPAPPVTSLEEKEKDPKGLSVRVVEPTENKKKAPKDNAGADWYNMPKTNLTPELKRDLQILRMRDVVALGKQYFKKDNRKDFIPEYSQVGTIIAGATDGRDNRLTRKERKRTIVEEVLGGEAVTKYKNKYQDLQVKKASGGKQYYKKLVAGRRKRH